MGEVKVLKNRWNVHKLVCSGRSWRASLTVVNFGIRDLLFHKLVDLVLLLDSDCAIRVERLLVPHPLLNLSSSSLSLRPGHS